MSDDSRNPAVRVPTATEWRARLEAAVRPVSDQEARFLRWLAGWDTSTCEAFLGIVERVRLAGAEMALPDERRGDRQLRDFRCPSCGSFLGRINPAEPGLTWCKSCKIEITTTPCPNPPTI